MPTNDRPALLAPVQAMRVSSRLGVLMARRSWSGSKVRKARARIAATLPAPCWRCGRMLWPDSDWTVGHLIDAMDRPDLEDEPSLQAAECARCNYSAGAAAGNRRRRRIAPTSRAW